MVKALITVVLLSFGLTAYSTAQSSQAYINLSLDSAEIFHGDAIVLEIESSGLLDTIDFSPLEAHSTVVRDTGGTRIAVIKGKVVEIAIKRIDLIPDKPGLLVIGPLLAGDVTSNSVHVKVLNETRPTWQPVTDDLRINTSLTPASPRVHQQALFTIELLHRYPVNNEEITLPDLSGFAKRVLFENRRTFKDEDKEWFRTQWQYLIFPQQSGPQTIGDITWTGTATKSRVERAEFSRTHQPTPLTILPATTDTGAWWLPASSLQLTEHWSSPATELRAGDEVERTIIISAQSVLAGQLPNPVVPESRALQQTLINTSRSEELNNQSMVASAEFTYRVKAQSPIPVFLDTVRIPWWNTAEGELKEAILPARRINVGLPDRADLLSNIALQESGVTRAKHWLQSTNWLRNIIYIAAALALVLMATRFFPEWLGRARRQTEVKKHYRKIRTLADDGDPEALYKFLIRPESRAVFAGNETDLINTLHHHLFSNTAAPKPALPLRDLVSTIRQPKLTPAASVGSDTSPLAGL